MTINLKFCFPAGYGVKTAVDRRVTIPRGVASIIILALTACLPERFAITTPAGLP